MKKTSLSRLKMNRKNSAKVKVPGYMKEILRPMSNPMANHKRRMTARNFGKLV